MNKTTVCVCFMLFLMFLLVSENVFSQYNVLHHFTGTTSDGAQPSGGVIYSNGYLYGVCWMGGSANKGMVYKAKANGSDFDLLHHFKSGSSDGELPCGSVLLIDTMLYGMTSACFTNYTGNIYKVSINGNGFEVLHTFTSEEGKWPWGSLICSDSVLYGMTAYGGNCTNDTYGKGSVFKMNMDGSGFQVLHAFAGATTDGKGPHGTLFLAKGILYGTTLVGGANDKGTIFKMNTDGSDFQLLYSFTGGTSDGENPYAVTFVKSGNTLYGTTLSGGSGGYGTIFKINIDGSDYAVLHQFEGGSNGQKPFGPVILSGKTLYGVASDESTGLSGKLYSIKTDGTEFTVLHTFEKAYGQDPISALLLIGSKFYGTTYEGGSKNKGVLFSFNLPESTSSIDYLGQTPPGLTPEVFATGTVSNANAHGRFVVSTDGTKMFWTTLNLSTYATQIMCVKYEDGQWSSTQVPSFAASGLTKNPVYSPDGSKLFFSYRTSVSSAWSVKYVEESGSGWGDLKADGVLLNTTSSFTDTGMAYFSDTMGTKGNYGGIYSAQFSEEGYSDIQPLEESINSENVNYTPYISSDGSYLIFSSSRPSLTESFGNMYLYVTFKNSDGSWTTPQKMFSVSGRFPSISPDGKYLFFCGDDMNIYWVDVAIIDQFKTSAAEYKKGLNDLMIYPNPTHDQFAISFMDGYFQQVSAMLFTLNGQKILTKTFQSTKKPTIDLSGYPGGWYLVKLIADGVAYNEKILKQ